MICHFIFELFREYRHRRRHRKDLNKLINDTEAIEDHQVACSTVQKSNSFRRRRNDSGEENPFTKRKMDQELELKVDEPYISTQIATLHSTIMLPTKGGADNHDICISVHTELDCKSEANLDLIRPDEHTVEAEELLEDTCPLKKETFENHDSAVEPKEAVDIIDNVEVQESKGGIVKTDKDIAEEEEDPLGFIAIKSAAQWMAVSKRISWNFEDKETEEDRSSNVPSAYQQELNEPLVSKSKLTTPTASTVTLKQIPEIVHDYENASYDIYCPEYNGQPEDFKPTKYCLSYVWIIFFK